MRVAAATRACCHQGGGHHSHTAGGGTTKRQLRSRAGSKPCGGAGSKPCSGAGSTRCGRGPCLQVGELVGVHGERTLEDVKGGAPVACSQAGPWPHAWREAEGPAGGLAQGPGLGWAKGLGWAGPRKPNIAERTDAPEASSAADTGAACMPTAR